LHRFPDRSDDFKSVAEADFRQWRLADIAIPSDAIDVRDGLPARKLSLDTAAAEEVNKEVCDQMMGCRQRACVRFYCLLAWYFNIMDRPG